MRFKFGLGNLAAVIFAALLLTVTAGCTTPEVGPDVSSAPAEPGMGDSEQGSPPGASDAAEPSSDPVEETSILLMAQVNLTLVEPTIANNGSMALPAYEEPVGWEWTSTVNRTFSGGTVAVYVQIDESSIHTGEPTATSGIRPCTWEVDLHVRRSSETANYSPNCPSESVGFVEPGLYVVEVDLGDLLAEFPMEIVTGDRLELSFLHRVVNGENTGQILFGDATPTGIELR